MAKKPYFTGFFVLFYSLNLATSDSELSEVSTFINYTVNEDLIHIKSQFIDQLITKDHNVVVSTSYDNKHWELMSVDKAMQKKRILMKRNSNPIQGEIPSTFTLPEVCVSKNNQYSRRPQIATSKEDDLIVIHDYNATNRTYFYIYRLNQKQSQQSNWKKIQIL